MNRTPARRQVIVLLVLLALALQGCRPYGPGVPMCGELELTGSGERRNIRLAQDTGESVSLRSAHLVQAQAVPTAVIGPCIDAPPAGWDFTMAEPASDAIEYQFGSTSLGLPFLTVTFSGACTPSPDADRVPDPVDGVARSIQVHDRGPGVHVRVVAVASRHDGPAFQLATNLADRQLQGNPVRSNYSPAGAESVGERIAAALADGDAVIVVDDTYDVFGELELRLPGVSAPIQGGLGTILAELGDRAEDPVYRATWWHVTDGGCTVYEFDAAGRAAATLPEDVDAAVGFFPLDELRQRFAELGYDLGGHR